MVFVVRLLVRMCVGLIGLLAPRRALFIDRLSSGEALVRYQQAFAKHGGVELPLDYLEGARVYGCRDRAGQLLGGFTVMGAGMPRVLAQIPAQALKSYLDTAPRHGIAEVTGLWMADMPHRRLRSAMLFLSIFERASRRGTSELVFSYGEDDRRLARLYSLTSPTIVYSGRVRTLPGMASGEEHREVVCAITPRQLLTAVAAYAWIRVRGNRRRAVDVPRYTPVLPLGQVIDRRRVRTPDVPHVGQGAATVETQPSNTREPQ